MQDTMKEKVQTPNDIDRRIYKTSYKTSRDYFVKQTPGDASYLLFLQFALRNCEELMEFIVEKFDLHNPVFIEHWKFTMITQFVEREAGKYLAAEIGVTEMKFGENEDYDKKMMHLQLFNKLQNIDLEYSSSFDNAYNLKHFHVTRDKNTFNIYDETILSHEYSLGKIESIVKLYSDDYEIKELVKKEKNGLSIFRVRL